MSAAAAEKAMKIHKTPPGVFRTGCGKILYYYPLSLLGTMTTAAGIWLLISFFHSRSPISLVIALGLLVLTATAVIMLFRSRKDEVTH